jgi:glucosamine kinase
VTSLLVAGIDGGQSSTVAVVGDQRGRILSRGVAGPADEVGAVSNYSTRLHDALRDALLQAARSAGIPDQREFAAIVAGVSGYEGRVYGAEPELPTRSLVLLHDAPIAHAGALGGAPGVVVIAGTGSVVYSRDERDVERTYGGWGFCFGDEGSAFRIARDALATLMQAQDDGDSSAAPEIRSACEFFAKGSLRAIARAFYSGEMSREKLASYAPSVLRAVALRAIVERNAQRLVDLACLALSPIAERTVALTGGLFADAAFFDCVSAGIAARAPEARVARPMYEPAAGALLLAYRKLGIPVTELSS